jgi:hypothetical protein
MSTEQGYGVEIEIDSIRNVLAPTQTLRLALDVLPCARAYSPAIISSSPLSTRGTRPAPRTWRRSWPRSARSTISA